MHAELAKKRALKLSYYYPNASSRIIDANSSIGGTFIRDRNLTNRQKSPNLGSFFQSNYSWYSYATAGQYPTISIKSGINHIFYNANPETFIIHTRISLS